LGKLFGKKVYLYGIGIGPINRSISERLTLKAFRMADGKYVRDAYSYDWLQSRGVSCDLAADVVFTVAGEHYYGYNPMFDSVLYIPSHKWENLDVDQVDGNMVIFFPGKDLPMTAVARGTYIDGLELGVLEIVSLFKQYKGAVVGRLHAGILATIAGLPFVAIPYDVKLTEYARELAATLGVPQDALLAKNITEAKAKLAALLKDSEKISNELVRFSIEQKKRAEEMMAEIERAVE